MALANVGTSSGTYTYSGIKMKYTMTINSVSKSGSDASVNYTLKSERVSGSGHPYASIQSKLNGTQVYNSGYNNYSSWPGAEGSKSFTHTASGVWGSSFTFQVTGHVGSSSSNTLSGNVQTITWNTVTYSTAQGTAPASSGQYTGNSVTVAAAPSNLPNAWRFDGWNTKQDGTGTAYSPGATITFNNANITLYAQLTLLKPTMNIPTLGTATEDSIPYGALSADINGCTYEYTVDNGVNWNTANANGGSVTQVKSGTALEQNHTYEVKFRATYLGNVSNVVSAGSRKTDRWPYITSLSTTTINAGSAVTIYLYNPFNRKVTITPSIGGATVGSAKDTATTSASITLNNNDIIAKFGETDTFKAIVYTSNYSGHTSTSGGNIYLTSATGPTVNNGKIDSFITISNLSDGKGDASHFIRGKSSFKILLSSTSSNNAFTASTGTSINTSSYQYSINGGTKTSITLGTASAVYNIPSGTETIKIEIFCKDNRNFSNVNSCVKTINTIAVTSPTISLNNAKRTGSNRTGIVFSSSGAWNNSITAINSYNQGARLVLRYKENGASSWGPWQEIYGSGTNINLNNTDKSITGTFNISKSYDFQLGVRNKYETNYINSNSITVSKAEPIMFIDAGTNGVGINCFPSGEGGLWLKRTAGNKKVAIIYSGTSAPTTSSPADAEIGDIYIQITS